jgi:16S rRNA (guanine(966)-N(2))-methyltransferase RsmD
MKITGGKAKGKIIYVPKKIIRPTQNILREALFNIIGASFLKNAVVLDLFCGSGALGIEALSRGAKKAVFVDNNKRCLSFVGKNLAVLKQEIKVQASLIKEDAVKAIKKFHGRGKKFDLVFADPAYHRGLGKKCLQALDEYDILTADALIIIEYFKKESLQIEAKNLIFLTTRQYGDTKVSFFKKT